MSLRHGYLRPPRRRWHSKPDRRRALISTDATKSVGPPLLTLALSLCLMAVIAALVFVACAVLQ
jgi:hypothetical protein